MIDSKNKLKEYLKADSKNYKAIAGQMGLKMWVASRFLSNPISDQSKIWSYIKTLRYTEYYYSKAKSGVWGGVNSVLYLWSLHKLRSLSRITGFQIPPNTVGKGVTIWHWGALIINGNASIGENCVFRPDVVVGHKTSCGKAPRIGDKCVLNSGCRVIGDDITIGDNVIIAPGAIVTKSIPSNCVVAGVPARIIKVMNS